MLKNPYLNAVYAALYIALVVFLVSSMTAGPDNPNTIILPMLLLSIFVLSVALMAALFFYEPVKLYIEQQKLEAAAFFGKTLGTFACIVFVFLAAALALR